MPFTQTPIFAIYLSYIKLSKNMYEKALKQAGLTEKQASIYAVCLELGVAKAPEIAKRANIKRTTTYGILDELVTMGLITENHKGRIKFYKAQNPESLLSMLDTRKQALETALPHLKTLFSGHHFRPQIQFFEGKEGVKRIYEDTLSCVSKKIYQVVRVKDFIDFPGGDFSEQYIKKRATKKITAYALHPKSGDLYNKIYGTASADLKRNVRYLPPSAFYASMIMIYDNKVAMISTKEENFGFIIESKQFSGTLKAYFQFMWGLGSKEPEE